MEVKVVDDEALIANLKKRYLPPYKVFCEKNHTRSRRFSAETFDEALKTLEAKSNARSLSFIYQLMIGQPKPPDNYFVGKWREPFYVLYCAVSKKAMYVEPDVEYFFVSEWMLYSSALEELEKYAEIEPRGFGGIYAQIGEGDPDGR